MINSQKLKVSGFGPIKFGAKGFIEFKRCTVFIGDQGTGKSTIVKLFSTLSWLEKSIIAKKTANDKITFEEFKSLLAQQDIPDEYFNKDTAIEYSSKVINIKVEKMNIKIRKIAYIQSDYVCPKIQYVPSERNLLSIGEKLHNISGIPEMLLQYNNDLLLAMNNIENIDFQKFKLKYNRRNGVKYVVTKDRESKVDLHEASSGIKSIFPMLFVSKNNHYFMKKNFIQRLKETDDARRQVVIARISDEKLKNKVKNYIMSGIEKGINTMDLENLKSDFSNIVNSCFVEIVEEPEQNLFPISQVYLLKMLVEDTSEIGDKLIMSTHSPYILSELNNYIYAKRQYDKYSKKIREIDSNLFIDYNDVSAYKISDGEIFDIMDSEYGGIDVNEIDECSINISKEFDKLLSIGE